MTRPFPRLQAAAVDGRQQNIYHRQEQLERLCGALISHVDAITNAIVTDHGHSDSDAALEYAVTLQAIKHFYSLLDPKTAHERECRIAHGRDAADNQAPPGIVYIEPTAHTLFYAAVVPLAAAIAAGNCVVVLLESNLRTLPRLLQRILTGALDPDVFAVASSQVQDEEFLEHALCVFQSGSDLPSSFRRLVSFPQSPVVAVVDRTADVQLAADQLVTASLGFRGQSPYAPDIVLVNEFQKDAFLRAVVEQSEKFAQQGSRTEKTTSKGAALSSHMERLRAADPGCRIVSEEKHLAVLDLASRDAIMKCKPRGPVLAVHAITSLDDAIDLIASRTPSCLAAYHFSDPPTAKYLSQFIPAEATFVNHIPRALLVGPAAPSGHAIPHAPERRYRPEMFQLPRPAFVKPPPPASNDLHRADAETLLRRAVEPLREMRRAAGGGVGFFEQGFLITASLVLACTLTASVTGALWLWRFSRTT